MAGHLPAADLRTHHLVGVPLTYQFVRASKSLTRWAVEEEMLGRDPLKKLPLPKCGQRTRVIRRDELARLYRSSPRWFRLYLLAMRYTIARPGELRNLRWSQVDLAAGVIRLRKFKAKDKRKDNLQERTIAVGVPALRVLTAWHRRRNPAPADPVFPGRGGSVRTGNAVRCTMRRARAAAGIVEDSNGERVVIYTMRHTGATEAIRAGVPQMLLARMMGHSKLETTARYVHLEESDMLKGIGLATGRKRAA